MPVRTEIFPALQRIPGLASSFVLRQPDIPVECAKPEAVARLEPSYREAVEAVGFPWEFLQLADQVHGDEIAVVSDPQGWSRPTPGVDGLITRRTGVLLGIMVADCCAVFLVDPVQQALGLIHAGKQGAALGVVSKALFQMTREFGARPENIVAQLSPCIRPPCYEVDIPEEIRTQLRDGGVPAGQIHDCDVCTGCDTERYYSYRKELGRTGRMLALLGWRE